MRVVVLGRNGVGSRSHYVTGYHGPGCIWLDIVFQPDTPRTMVPCNIMRSQTCRIMPQNHYTHASIA